MPYMSVILFPVSHVDFNQMSCRFVIFKGQGSHTKHFVCRPGLILRQVCEVASPGVSTPGRHLLDGITARLIPLDVGSKCRMTIQEMALSPVAIFVIPMSILTPSTLDSCSYRFKMYLRADNMPFHMVKTIFKYSF